MVAVLRALRHCLEVALFSHCCALVCRKTFTHQGGHCSISIVAELDPVETACQKSWTGVNL
jgi:hypothetical protein